MVDISLMLFLNRIILKMKLKPFYNIHPHSEMRKMHQVLDFLSQCTKHEECLVFSIGKEQHYVVLFRMSFQLYCEKNTKHKTGKINKNLKSLF